MVETIVKVVFMVAVFGFMGWAAYQRWQEEMKQRRGGSSRRKKPSDPPEGGNRPPMRVMEGGMPGQIIINVGVPQNGKTETKGKGHTEK